MYPGRGNIQLFFQLFADLLFQGPEKEGPSGQDHAAAVELFRVLFHQPDILHHAGSDHLAGFCDIAVEVADILNACQQVPEGAGNIRAAFFGQVPESGIAHAGLLPLAQHIRAVVRVFELQPFYLGENIVLKLQVIAVQHIDDLFLDEFKRFMLVGRIGPDIMQYGLKNGKGDQVARAGKAVAVHGLDIKDIPGPGADDGKVCRAFTGIYDDIFTVLVNMGVVLIDIAQEGRIAFRYGNDLPAQQLAFIFMVCKRLEDIMEYLLGAFDVVKIIDIGYQQDEADLAGGIIGNEELFFQERFYHHL